MIRLLFVVVLMLLSTATAQEGEQQQQVPAKHQSSDTGDKSGPKKPRPIQQGLVGSPLKLRLTYHIYLFFLGIPIGTLVFSAFLFFGYIGLSKSPVDIPLQLN